MKLALMRIILWAVGFYVTFALLSWLTGKEIQWGFLIFQSILVSLIVHGLEWVYKKKFEKK